MNAFVQLCWRLQGKGGHAQEGRPVQSGVRQLAKQTAPSEQGKICRIKIVAWKD